MFLKVQAVINNDGKWKGNVEPGVHANAKFVFVSNRGQATWYRGVGEFVITTGSYGTPIDFQALLFVDPSKEVDTCIIPVTFFEGEFKVLPTFNQIVSGWEQHIYKFHYPIYLIRVRRDGQARIDEYTPLFEEKDVKKGAESYILKIRCENVYNSLRPHFDNELILKADMKPMLQPLARFLKLAWQTLHTTGTDDASADQRDNKITHRQEKRETSHYQVR
jgi:hypothetical protein